EAACRKEEEERRARERQEEEEAKCLEKFEGAEPLEAAELLAFTDSMLPGCSQLLDELPDTVYRVCDLIMTAVKRNGAAYRDSVLKQVVKQVWEAADVLIKAALPLTTSDTKTVSEWISQMATLPQASNLATRILLLTLLFEQYLQATGNNWRWFDDRSGRWCSYSASNNSTIDAAWRAGETSVRFTAGRRRYTVQFTTMVQVNEETGNRRPVMLTLLRAPRSGKGGKDGAEGERASEEGRDPEGRGKEEPPAASPEEGREGRKEKDGERGEERQRAKGSKPLMPTSTILRLLAELVRSYVGIATLIANYSYTVGQSELIKEDCSVLAFVLDHLLPHTQNAEDKDTPALARLFLASLAAAGSGTDAQVALVNEVKAALGRALAMAESTEKHARLQAVMCIISTIMESCPSTSSFYSSAAKTQHNGMNNIIRLFLKKGLVNDLARVPHSLDLSRFGGTGGCRDPTSPPLSPPEDSMNILDPEDEEEHTQEEDSSGSNEDEDDSQDEEEEEEEEDEDDQDDEEGEEGEEEEDDDDGSEMELDEDYPDMNASPLVRFERFDRDDDLIIEFDNIPSGSSVDSLLRLRGRLLLDHEALSCLLVLLFVDEPKLNTSRLHRVLRNLCYHAPTRG
ncbi:PREDICTED: E3 ubiquitin-protein ligase HUWE1-like, partial [Nipponia nippon]|uniref:E3 ubiquitin-protein ligase HUWE1-like n=1 Tax=Nipponia nippon TaxID=128390 RepID=UPI0005119F9F